MHVHGRPGTTVSIGEQVGNAVVPVANVPLSGANADRPQAVRWRCDRRTRSFVASAPGTLRRARGGFGADHDHFVPAAPERRAYLRRTRAGRRVAVRLRDRFGVGELPVSLCTTPPAARRRCRTVKIEPGKKAATARLRVVRPGRWRVRRPASKAAAACAPGCASAPGGGASGSWPRATR